MGSHVAVVKRLQATIAEIEDVLHICNAPSISFGVLHEGKVIFRSSHGLRDVEKGLAADSDTSYLIGSCSKLFTSLALGVLVEDGIISWEDPIRQHLPDFDPSEDSEIGKTATTIDACRHSTGLANPNAVFMGPEGTLNLSGGDHLQLINALPTSNHSGQRFGQWWYYSNATFGLMANLIERCTSITFAHFLRDRILKPLGLDQTLISMAQVAENTNVAHPYAKLANGEWQRVKNGYTDESYPATLACMGIRTSVNDFLRLFSAVMQCYDEEVQADSTVPSAATNISNPLHQVNAIWNYWWTRHIDDGFENDTKYLLGWFHTRMPTAALGMLSFNRDLYAEKGKSFGKYIIGRDSPRRDVYGHNGITNGSTSVAYLFPESHSAVVVLCNASDWGDAAETTSQILIQALFDLKPHVDLLPAVLESRDLGRKAWETIISDWQRDRDVSKFTGIPADFQGTYIGLSVSIVHIIPSETAEAGVAVVFGNKKQVKCDCEPYNTDTLSFLPLTHEAILTRGMIDWDYYKVGLFEFVRDEGEVVAFWWRWDRFDYSGLWVKQKPGMSVEDLKAVSAKHGGPFRRSDDIGE